MDVGSDFQRPDRSPTVPRWLRSASEVAWRLLAVAVAVAVVGFVLVRLRIVVIPLGIALLIAGVLAPPASWLKERGLPPLVATWIVALVAMAALVGVLWFVSAQLAGEVSALGSVLAEGWRRLVGWLNETPLGAVAGEDPLSRISSQLGSDRIADWLISGAATAVEVGSMLLLTLFFTFFFVKDGERLFAAFLRQLDRRDAHRAEAAGVAMWNTLARYFRGLGFIALINAILKGLALLLIGVPLVLVIMLVTFVGSFIPFLGPVIAAAVGALVALTSGGPVDALLVALAGIAIQQFEGNVLEPLIMGRVMKLHPMVVLAAVAAGATLAGLPGAFFAVPVTAVATALYSHLRSRVGLTVPTEEPAEEAAGARP